MNTIEFIPEKSTSKRRVYSVKGEEEAKAFANKYNGSYFEYLPDVYRVIL